MEFRPTAESFQVDEHLRHADVARTIRFTDDLFEQLHEVSSRHRISFNLLVLQCCEYSLRNVKDSNK